jgi:hypothetical protein
VVRQGQEKVRRPGFCEDSWAWLGIKLIQRSVAGGHAGKSALRVRTRTLVSFDNPWDYGIKASSVILAEAILCFKSKRWDAVSSLPV